MSLPCPRLNFRVPFGGRALTVWAFWRFVFKTKAELSYALHCLEREVAICRQQRDEIERLRREVAELKCKLAVILSDVQGN